MMIIMNQIYFCFLLLKSCVNCKINICLLFVWCAWFLSAKICMYPIYVRAPYTQHNDPSTIVHSYLLAKTVSYNNKQETWRTWGNILSFQEQNKFISDDILRLTAKTVKFCDQMKVCKPKIFQSAICFPFQSCQQVKLWGKLKVIWTSIILRL